MKFSLSFSHVGFYVKSMKTMVNFYTSFLGFVVSDFGQRAVGGEIYFLTRDPSEHHQLVFASGRPDNLSFNMINQLSFRVDSLATLRLLYSGLQSYSMKEIHPVTHGNALSVYFHDPENNRIELLIDTPWYVPQPHRVPVDLSLADDDLWLMIEQGVKKLPGFMSQSDWLMQMKVKIAAADKHRLTNSI